MLKTKQKMMKNIYLQKKNKEKEIKYLLFSQELKRKKK
jgi:hypothetical protein